MLADIALVFWVFAHLWKGSERPEGMLNMDLDAKVEDHRIMLSIR